MLPILDCGAEETSIPEKCIPPQASKSKHVPTLAIFPNGETTTSTGAVAVQSGSVNLNAKVYRNENLMRPLIAAHDITSQGNTIVLNSRSLIVKDQKGKILACSPKDPDARLWSMPALKATSVIHDKHERTVNDDSARGLNNVIHHSVHASITSYANAIMGSPPDKTMQQALDRDYFQYPGMNAQMYRKNPPHAIESSEGHMKQSRQNVRSSQLNDKTQENFYNSVTKDIAPSRAYSRMWDTSSSDLPGPFPVASLKGSRYILITTYRNYIHGEPMKSRSQQDYKRGYANTFKFFKDLGHTPKFHRMDNETSSHVEHYLEQELGIPVQYVPPGSHRTLPAERSIQTYKNHFISSVGHMHPDCPLQLWESIMPQIEDTLACLLPYSVNPCVSAYEGIHGRKYDFSAHPMHPVGSLTIAFTPTTSREAWEVHGMKGYMLGPARKHYRSYRVYIIETGKERTTDTVDVFPTKVMLPGSSLGELILKRLAEDPSDNPTKADKIEEIRKLFKSNQRILERRVPTMNPVIPVPQQRVQSSAPHHLTVSSRTTKRNKVTHSTYEQYPIHMIVATKRKKILDHVGRTFKDTGDGQTYQVQRVVKSKADKKSPPTPFYELANIHEHSNSKRMTELDHEYQPCEEFFILKRNGEYHYRGNEYEWLPTLNSVFHARIDQQLLNLDDDGKPLTNRTALKSIHRDDWLIEHAKEIKNLMNTGTIVPRKPTEQPRDRWKDTKHYSPQVKEKLADDSTVTRRVRGTFGGNNLNYPFATTSPVADRLLINIHQQSVLADRKKTKEDWRYMCADFKDYYLGSKLPRSEWLRISTKYMNQDLLTTLQEYIVNGTVLFEVVGSMYGHPAAGLISYTDLTTHLASHGYHQSRLIPCLFMNHDKSITFTLVVDDIGIKYKHGSGEIDHLQKVLAKPISKWDVKFDLTGSQYNGQRLQWNYGTSDSTLIKDVPAYMRQTAHELHPGEKIRKYTTPSRYVAPTYGKQDTAPMQSTAAPTTAAETKYIQQVHGKLLYYAMNADPSLEPAVIDISKQLAKPNQDTLNDVKRLLGYAVHNPNKGILYTASDMEYRIQTDASHHRDPGSKSMAGGIHYLSNADDPPTKVNGATQTVCKSINTSVCASAAESEYAAQFINGIAGCHALNILNELGYPQSKTKMYSDNLVAKGIANDEITIRKSKAFHTRYHWIRDRVRQGQYQIVYLPGSKLLADFFTKPQPPIKQKYFASQLTVPTN